VTATYEYDDLKHKTVNDLREIAHESGIEGSTQMNKDHLLQVICDKLGIEMHHHVEVVGIDKSAVKAQIKELKQKRQAALEARDGRELKQYRRKIRRLKRKMRRAMVIK